MADRQRGRWLGEALRQLLRPRRLLRGRQLLLRPGPTGRVLVTNTVNITVAAALGLPGHSFVLIDKQGRQRWYGEYPSMWLAPQDLLAEVRARLS